ncbi:hypothetical protein J7L05_00335 [bacterium]|nr:hypothetical protein [bacterium]
MSDTGKRSGTLLTQPAGRQRYENIHFLPVPDSNLIIISHFAIIGLENDAKNCSHTTAYINAVPSGFNIFHNLCVLSHKNALC